MGYLGEVGAEEMKFFHADFFSLKIRVYITALLGSLKKTFWNVFLLVLHLPAFFTLLSLAY